MTADLNTHVAEILHTVGLSKREIRADWNMVPPALRKAIPKDRLEALASGSDIKGFGLGSDTGTGKTMALAALVKRLALRRVRAWAEELPSRALQASSGFVVFEPPRSMPLRWLCWPDFVTWLRANATSDEAEDRLQAAESIPLLVLDDLGRERIKGSYIDDWAASQLDRIISHRYREELPILWTTNLREQGPTGLREQGPTGLIPLYGAALVSRLTQDAPLAWVEDLPSLRLA